MKEDDYTPMHHYPWHPGDYQLKTNHWSEERTSVQCEAGLLRDLAYRRLIDLYMTLGGPIPDKTHWVATRVRMVAHTEIVGSVLKEKFAREPGLWRNDKCDSEIAKYRKRVVANQENGKKGGRKPNENPPANPLGSKPRTKNHKPKNTPLPPEGEVWWEEFWQAYPRKEAKKDAYKAFATALGRASSFQAIMEGLRRFIGCDQWTSGDETKIPHASTWLNGDRWNDTPAKAGGQPAGAAARWWETGQGIMDKGIELGLPAPASREGPPFWEFTAMVWIKMGDGEWIDDKMQAYRYFTRMRDGGAT